MSLTRFNTSFVQFTSVLSIASKFKSTIRYGSSAYAPLVDMSSFAMNWSTYSLNFSFDKLNFVMKSYTPSSFDSHCIQSNGGCWSKRMICNQFKTDNFITFLFYCCSKSIPGALKRCLIKRSLYIGFLFRLLLWDINFKQKLKSSRWPILNKSEKKSFSFRLLTILGIYC